MPLVRVRTACGYPNCRRDPPRWQVTAFEAYTEVWQIPLVKRLVALVSQIVFTGFTCIVFLRTQCGNLENYHYVWFLWLGANIVSEFIHFKREPEIWLSNVFNWVRAARRSQRERRPSHSSSAEGTSDEM